MNIYQEVYDIIQNLRQQWINTINVQLRSEGRLPLPSLPMFLDEEQKIQQWLYVANELKQNYSSEIVRVAQQKYPILQQIFQMNESEVRS